VSPAFFRVLTEPLLFARFPNLRALPWISLAQIPTPVQQATLQLDRAVSFWVKRDDQTSTVYGGNKVRKLEFILAAARARGIRRLITAGAAGSHHALATAVYGAQLGFKTTLVLFPQPLTDHVREVLLTDFAFGAELRWTSRMTMVPGAITAARFVHWRERTSVIPPGGSDPTGTLGYVNATLELGDQIEAGMLPVPDEIVVAAGTLGTSAGIALGLALLRLPTRLRATRITSRLVTNERALHGLIRATATLLRAHDVPVDAETAIERVALSHEQIGAGYGRITEAAAAAQAAFATLDLQLDPTYTAKAAADFLVALRDRPESRLLFWHTLSSAMPAVQLPPVAALPGPFRTYLEG
jgi:1-aminocyclopropane-1-carboxylate deaminase/D-cysteine desulfhydrase-like pyridoxal-dependent ACC family enzyme